MMFLLDAAGSISTEFQNEITNDDELIAAIRNGECAPKHRVPITIKAELIPPISAKDIDILEKYKPKKEPALPLIKASNESVKFFDSK